MLFLKTDQLLDVTILIVNLQGIVVVPVSGVIRNVWQVHLLKEATPTVYRQGWVISGPADFSST